MPDDVTLPVPVESAGAEEERRSAEITVLTELLNLVTSFHNQRRNDISVYGSRYLDTVALSARCYAEGQVLARTLIGLFDVDTAVGQQLDFTGQWIGLTRFIDIILDVWFSFDRYDLGFDAGKWRTPYEAWTETIELGDDAYRILLYARIVANHWDGTIPHAEEVWDTLFRDTGYQIILQDGYPCWDPYCHSSMKITQCLLGPYLDRVTYALFAGGYLGVKSAGVGLEFMVQWQGRDPQLPSGVGHPFFGFDCDPPPPKDIYPPTTIAGFDEGHWGQTATELIPPEFVAPIGDAPADGITYGRRDGDWRPALRLAGDTMQGPLNMARHPGEPDETTTRDYKPPDVDSGRY